MRLRRMTALVVLMSLILAACAGSTQQTTTTSVEGGSETTQADTTPTTGAAATEPATAVTIGLQLEPPTLDLTASPAAAIPQVLLYNVYETLVRLEADGSITGLLAKDWEISDDGLNYTFHLQEGVTFHNGAPFIADDVVFSLNNVINNPDHPFTTTLQPIESVVAVDDTTVELHLSQVSANLLFFLTQGQGVILTESAIDTIENQPIGTGPFEFVSWTVGDNIVLKRSDTYWGDEPPLEQVTFRYINDPNALNSAMLAEDIDIIAGVSAPELLEEFLNDDRFDVLQGLTYGEIVHSLNGRNPPLDDVRVRQAITQAIDKQAIVDLAYSGFGVPIGTFSTPLDPWYKDLTDVYPYDPDRARELLDEAGVDGLTL
ncbi:MAG TPA: ABC transporter substrate-binding protein, partial [Acidimicrobiia bacterium]|nr:ABC transporter substrate-binding protein [Acidimicrobiia bacterium]